MCTARSLASFSLLIFFAGCAGDVPAGIPVEGSVTFRGAPLERGSIEFSPLNEQGAFSGAEIVEGSYLVPAENGLTPGEYEVRISASSETAIATDEAPGESTVTAKELIPPEFNVATTLKVQVKEEQDNSFDFQIP